MGVKKLPGIFAFEFRYQMRRVWPWLLFAVLTVFCFFMTRDGSLPVMLYQDLQLNAPFTVAKTYIFGTLIWMLFAASIAGESAARDISTGMYPLVFTTSLSRLEYLGGRFLAALVINLLVLQGVTAGILLGIYAPGVDPALVAPFRAATFLTGFAYITLPNAVVATALQFVLALRSGRTMAGYLGSMTLFFMGFFVASLIMYRQRFGPMFDPIGVRFIMEEISRSWTEVEKSTRLLSLSGTILANRVVWLSVAASALIATLVQFRFVHRAERSGVWRRLFQRSRASTASAPVPSTIAISSQAPVVVPNVTRSFGAGIALHQLLATAWISFRAIATSWAGLALLVFLPVITLPVLIDQMSSLGSPLVPTTIRILGELIAPLSDELSRWVIVPLLLVFFAGELVWREREAGLGDISDAMPGSDWTPLVGKFLGLALVVVVFLAAQMCAGLLAQTILGYSEYDVSLYLQILLGLQLPEYLLFALLTMVVHAVVNQKYVGHLVAILAYVFITLASLFGVEHNLLVFGAAPQWSYTEMRGFGGTVTPWLWFKLYWVSWSVLLAVVARLFWNRGREHSVRLRLAIARQRFRGPTAITAGVASTLILTFGSYVFYNTNVRHDYRTADEVAERSAEYERRYGRFAAVTQPHLAIANLEVDLHPAQPSVDITGTYHLVNRSAAAIDSVHVATPVGVSPLELTINRSAVHAVNDSALGHHVFVLATPLAPGDAMQLNFRVHVAPRGFAETGIDPSLAANGTFIGNNWLPAIGYQSSRELMSPSERRAYQLPSRTVIPSLYSKQAPLAPRGGTQLNTVLSTTEDQVAVAPGALQRTWVRDGRRYFHYETSAPIGNEWVFASARYAVHDETWNNPDQSGQSVQIRLYHHPTHTQYLDRTLRSIRASLTYYSAQFGPYPYTHLTMVERPGEGTGLHADASMLSHSEGFVHWHPRETAGSLDMPYAVVAHEMGHQWGVPSAYVEGAPVMSESLAWYYAMRLVQHTSGTEQLRRLTAFMREPYPYAPIRRGEPLLRGLDPYMSYRRGPFALQALSEYVGEAHINSAMRSLRNTHLPDSAPLATTLDLYRELKAVTPDSLNGLLHDLFEVNTYWSLETEQASMEKMAENMWQVTLDVRARKSAFDSAGVETIVPMDEWVEVGVFSEGASEPLYLQKHRIRTGSQRIVVSVPKAPSRAGIDPFHLLIDSTPQDNVRPLRASR
ncbi:MAG TPA: hypothetical protein DGD08_18495 [Gemmatimonas aurantiaca]|uniref:Peptidase M1 membrane alanine aminopeptidase domain-containing protein n=3 Tax=Gemmatimonas aurantiaca TaxID=173480 RepID=A0A3D4VDM6_9BACT|nr:hypothetical protein [Gemmatimonas aurantiaca]